MAAKDEHGQWPLTWGYRVEPPKFGFGTVEGEPVPTFGPIMEPTQLPQPRRIVPNPESAAVNAGQYRAALAALKLSQKASARLLRVNGRTVQR